MEQTKLDQWPGAGSPVGAHPQGHEPEMLGRQAPDLELTRSCIGDTMLFETFIQLRARSRGALVALSDRLMITNASAGEVLQPLDRPNLWARAQSVVKEGVGYIGELSLTNGSSVMARYQPVLKDKDVVGVVVQFPLPHAGRSARRPLGGGVAGAPVPGWDDLTNTERAVAEVVAGGLTNRQAGSRVCMSRHTVDSHLRHIFGKLKINSRVELARLVGEHYRELSGSEEDQGLFSTDLGPSTYEPLRSA